MQRSHRFPLLPSLALVAALNAPALAHGGAYKGPPGEIPPESREPSDPPPPPDTGPPATPPGDSPGGPTTGSGDVPGPKTGDGPGNGPGTGGPPSGGPPTGPSGTSGPKSGGGGPRGSQTRGLEDWTFWWHANDDALLGLRKRMRDRRSAPTGSGAHALGEAAGGANRVLETTRSAVNDRIVPALREILADESEDPDARSAAALGLAKIGDPQSVPDLLRIVREGRKSPRIVEESAALALGLLRSPSREVRATLLETAADRDRDGTFARPFAAVALGLAPVPAEERPALAKALFEILRRPETGIDIKPCVLQALGLLGEPSVAADLLAVATDPKALPGNARASDLERAHAVHALGRIGRSGFGDARFEAAAIDGILELTADREPRLVRQSATVALGLVGVSADAKARRRIVAALDRLADEQREKQMCHYALIAVGRIAAAPGTEEALRNVCLKRLRHALEKGQPANLTPPFAALGLGLVVHGGAAGPLDEEGIALPLRKRFAEEKDGKTRAAYAVALGLVQDSRAVEDLVAVLDDTGNPVRLRGYAALALGMIGADDGRRPVRAALVSQADPELRVLAAMGAGLLGDARAGEDLVAILGSKDESQYVLGSAALALGRIGDENAVDPLLAVARDSRRHGVLTRALSVVALGQIGDRSDVPTLARFAEDIDYRAATPAMAELLTIL